MEMKIYIILVGLKGGVNLGLIARVLENFMAEEIRLVKPELTDKDIEKAWIFSARARKVLDEKLKIYGCLRDAIKDVDVAFATSAVSAINNSNIRRKAITPREAVDITINGGYKKVGIVFGRESTGLTNEEIDLCDNLITIEGNPDYKTLNVAMSVAIILYIFFISRDIFKIRREYASRDFRKRAINYFYNISKIVTKNIDYADRTTKAFSNILNRGTPDYKEIMLIMNVFRRTTIILKKYKGDGI